MNTSRLAYRRTCAAVIGTNILNEPLMTIYASLAFLLYKDLGASDITVMALTMLKPVVAIFALYWCQRAFNRKDRLRENVIVAGIVGRLPFLLFPWIDDARIIVVCAAFFLMSYRAGTPAWIEILKLNLSDQRGRIYAWGSAIGFAEGAALAIAFGSMLDADVSCWRWLFPLSGVLGILAVALQWRVPVDLQKIQPAQPDSDQAIGEGGGSFKEGLMAPWKHTLQLMHQRPDFRHFQWGMMLCGGGLMIIQPALPIFFVDVLNITYKDLMIALHVCKGLGFALTSPFWGRKIHEMDIFNFTAIVSLGVGVFPLLLLCAKWNVLLLYLAYFFYGIGQAGCRLCWGLSGTIFSGEEDSSAYTGVNVLTVGLRGMIIPPIGIFLCRLMGPLLPLFAGLCLCWCAAFLMQGRSSLAHKSQLA